MNHARPPRRIDLYEAVKYDIRLHGFRFIVTEFALATAGAFAVAVVEFAHSAHGGSPLWGGLWFLSVGLNTSAVVVMALAVRATAADTTLGDRRLHLYALQLTVLLLVPCAVVLVALRQWRAGDYRARFHPVSATEMS
jgi:hypothetical protein